MDSSEQDNATTLLNLMRLLQGSGSGGRPGYRLHGISRGELEALFNGGGDADSDEDDGDYYPQYMSHDDSYRAPRWYPPVTEPQEAGAELLRGGDFGQISTKCVNPSTNLGRLITTPNTSPRTRLGKEPYAASLVPNTPGTAVASYRSNVYTAQFSKDSSFYYTCSQDYKLHIYDTTVPSYSARRRLGDVTTTMAHKRCIQAIHGSWTITDANLSPDNERMVYASITSTAHITSTVDPNPVQVPIEFSDGSRGNYHDSFGIWSCRFSADGNEIVAGGSGKIFVYDLLANKRTVKINAHADDVNSCTWADTSSGNVLISASDDSYLKVWDRRSLGASKKPSGVLVGHTEGITYVSAKGDGRYVISNGKDQTVRLWDLRKMRSSQEADELVGRYGVPNFDYRYPGVLRKPKYDAHPGDCSVMTYRGHSVMRTLIRCHFSPAETTGSQYIYSGSADGRIHIWSLDGRIVQVLDRSQTNPMSFDPSEPEPGRRSGDQPACVRDLSWHSQEPVLMSAAWGHGGSVVARHEWKGLSKTEGALEDWNERMQREYNETVRRSKTSTTQSDRRRGTRRSSVRVLPGHFNDADVVDAEDDEEEEEDGDWIDEPN